MKIFVLEDNIERQKWFSDRYFLYDLFMTEFPDNAIKILEKEKFDIIFIDHDLGLEKTGYDVAKTISQSINKDTLVVVHSCNTVGSDNICSVLKNVKKIPFGCLR